MRFPINIYEVLKRKDNASLLKKELKEKISIKIRNFEIKAVPLRSETRKVIHSKAINKKHLFINLLQIEPELFYNKLTTSVLIYFLKI